MINFGSIKFEPQMKIKHFLYNSGELRTNKILCTNSPPTIDYIFIVGVVSSLPN